MRLSDRIKKYILVNIEKSFGKVEVYLFGSRVDKNRRGGDIDLAVNSNFSKDEFRKRKIKFLSLMLKSDFELKIDLVQYEKNDSLLSKEIENGKILLK